MLISVAPAIFGAVSGAVRIQRDGLHFPQGPLH